MCNCGIVEVAKVGEMGKMVIGEKRKRKPRWIPYGKHGTQQ